MKRLQAPCDDVRIRIRAVGFRFEMVDGVVTHDGRVSAEIVRKCVRKAEHKGKHRDQDGNEW